MPEQDERRRHHRLTLRLPLILSGEGDTGHFVEQAVSENISAGGVYFRSDVWGQMPVGTRVHVYVEIAPPEGQFAHPSRLRTVGRVCRLEGPRDKEAAAGGTRGVAIEFERALRFSA